MIEKAKIDNVRQIYDIIAQYARAGKMLPRALSDIYEHVRDFFVFKVNDKIKGISALHIVWSDLAEVRSLAVIKEDHRTGIGRQLVEACLKEAKSLGIKKVFALTYVPDFFLKLGFHRIDRNDLPKKIWTDCIQCPYFPDCKEEAVEIVLDDE